MSSDVLYALLLSAGAGFSTTIGAFLGILVKNPGPRFMSAVLGLAAGVMLMVSFVELFGQAVQSLGFGLAQVAFFSGMGIMFLIDVMIPHEYMAEKEMPADKARLMKTGMLVAAGLMIHNFPEGLATFVAALKDPGSGRRHCHP